MRIFVVDDEKPLADTLILILRHAGYEATAAYDCAAALSQMESFLPDVVICDVIMPGMDGIEVCRRIQADHPRCRIILFSGQADTNALIGDAREKGCSWELLAKPVDPEELLAKLASLKSKHL
jgi:DNA-binding response OmpR family regulator